MKIVIHTACRCPRCGTLWVDREEIEAPEGLVPMAFPGLFPRPCVCCSAEYLAEVAET